MSRDAQQEGVLHQSRPWDAHICAHRMASLISKQATVRVRVETQEELRRQDMVMCFLEQTRMLSKFSAGRCASGQSMQQLHNRVKRFSPTSAVCFHAVSPVSLRAAVQRSGPIRAKGPIP